MGVTTPAGPPGSPLGWHPPRAVLELAELVVDGALPALPQDALLEIEDDAPDAVRAAWREGWPVDVQDAEGTPVARISPDGTVTALRPFADGPLRSQRRSPDAVREQLAAVREQLAAVREQLAAVREQLAAVPERLAGGRPDTVCAVLVSGPLPTATVERIVRAAGDGRHALVWFAAVGSGPGGPLAPAALLRATVALAAQAQAAGVPGLAVPLALPLAPDGGPADPELARRVVAAYGADAVTDLTPRPGEPLDVHPAFAAELDRRVPIRPARGVTVFFTGLSGSGKSTVAKALAERLTDQGRRTVTMLDGDEVRRLLSHGLGFDRADRDLNIRRIGFVAAEVSRHGGIAVAAPIAPFDAVRQEVRRLVEAAGGDFVLVHVATGLAECERRDRKGLYARARRGEIADFTGISSPYERPADADLVVDTTGRDVAGIVDTLWSLLASRGHLDLDHLQ
jgi:sulfate adenylyltransferase